MKIIKRLSIAVGLSLLAACNSPSGGNVSQIVSSSPGNSTAKNSAAVAAQWAASCGLCHATGVGGAPRIGMAEEWQPRFAQGRELLLRHTIDGFNDMPPLGYCMSCEREDFIALIDFMAGTAP